MAKVDPRDFLLNTDYEMDKIVYFKDTKLTPDSFGTVTIAHNLGFAPLITGLWAKTPDFGTPQRFSSGAFENASHTSYIIDTVRCVATEHDIQFQLSSGQVASPTTYPFYVRIMGFEPSDSHAKIGKTSQNANTFILNTDYNYLKLYKKGVENITMSSDYSSTNPITIKHDFGYRPQALFWLETSYQGADYNVAAFDALDLPATSTVEGQTITSPKTGIESYTDRFVVKAPVPQYGDRYRLHYRIYYDETI